MYENITYDAILKRMLAQVPSEIDKREGSVIWNALAPAAVELQNMYIELDTILNESFADTQTRAYLIKRCAERGITPEAATYAVVKGVFSMAVAIGSRFSLDDYNYIVTQKISDCIYKLQCETTGSEPNQRVGTLIPIDYISGLETAELTEVLIPGENDENTEDLRSRYFDSLDAQAFGGNIADYKETVKAISGVGGVKVYPVWNGGGTVKLVILNSEFQKPSDDLITLVQTAVDPTQNHGEGYGTAPIGHIVTVTSVGEIIVNITTTITYTSGWTWEDIKTYAEEAVDAYLLELNKAWEDSDNIVVRISQIETRLLAIAGVTDISKTAINGAEVNLTLSDANIAVRGVING